MSQPSLKVIPLGGLGEVGLNLMLLECGDDILIIDCGVLFPDLYWLGLELVLPDFTYLKENAKRIRGLVVTHGHEDHIGAIPFLLKEIEIPIIYCSPFAARLMEDKCSEHGTLKKLLTHHVHAGDQVRLGCFEVEFIHVTHSTLETFALAIDTPHGTVVHSGDFKFDETPYMGPPSDKKRLGEIGKKKPLLLLSDSTNSEKCGHSLSERDISAQLDSLISEAKGAIVVALFASNIHRVQQLFDLAEKSKRKVFLSGRSMERYVQIALEQGHLRINMKLLRSLEELPDARRHEILVLSTGSQGESRSSLLRMAKNESRYLKILPGDTVILSSRNIPGNEKAVSFVINQMYKLGAEVHYDDLVNVHVSGHAYQEEQTELLSLIKPKYFIPIHGDYRHMTLHQKTALASEYVKEKPFIIENGQVWEFDGERAFVSGGVPSGRQWFFGGFSGTMDDESIKKRKASAKSGIVVVDCLVNARADQLKKPPIIRLEGFLVGEKIQKTISETMTKEAMDAFENWSQQNADGYTREQAVASACRRVVRRAIEQKPLVIVNFLSV